MPTTRSPVNKHKKTTKPRTLELKKETVIHLSNDLLKDVVGGNNSTKPSQCPTLCFT
jgi:hypothetical protein